MRPLDEISQFIELVRPLMKPNHTVTSLGQLSRWARLQDDKARRVLARMSEACGGDSLVELRGRKYALTSVGKELVLAGERLIAVGQQDSGAFGEVVTVEVAPEIDPLFLADPLGRFLDEWAGLAAVKLLPLDTEGVRTNVASGITSFGLGFAEADGSSGCALLERPVPWVVVVHPEHPLAERQTVSPDQLASHRVFAPAEFAERVSQSLARTGSASLVVLPTSDAVRVAARRNLGVGLDLDFGVVDDSDPFVRIPLAELPPLRLGLFLPRKAEALSEAAKFLLDLLKAPRPFGRKLQAVTEGGEPRIETESETLSV